LNLDLFSRLDTAHAAKFFKCQRQQNDMVLTVFKLLDQLPGSPRHSTVGTVHSYMKNLATNSMWRCFCGAYSRLHVVGLLRGSPSCKSWRDWTERL